MADDKDTKKSSRENFNKAGTPHSNDNKILSFPPRAIEDAHELGLDADEADAAALRENGAEFFFQETGLPQSRHIWHAYLLGQQSYLLNTGLPEDFRNVHYKMNCMMPAGLLAKFGEGFLDDDDKIPAAVIAAALAWQSVRDNPNLSMRDDVFTPRTLDAIYDVIEYNARRMPYESLSRDAQAVVIANQIVVTMQHASNMENWKFQIYSKTLTQEDVDASRAFHQSLITEKWPSTDSPLEEMLEKQLERLRQNLSDKGPMRIPASKKSKVFKLIPGGKPNP